MTMNATPRPWRQEHDNDPRDILAVKADTFVASCLHESDADLIVTAVNAYDDVVAFLRKLPELHPMLTMAEVEEARALLARLTEDQG